MRPQSAKAKGRRLQQAIVADLYRTFPTLRPGDIRSTSMGAGGEDVQLSAAARALIPYSIEAKNQERVNVWAAMEQAEANCGDATPLVVMKKNGVQAHAVVRWSHFLELMRRATASAQVTSDPIPPAPTAVDASRLRAVAALAELIAAVARVPVEPESDSKN